MDKNSFPKELTALKQWVCWRLEPDKKSGRDTKVPYSPGTGHRASASNPSTWGTLDEAVDAKDKYSFSGIGFVFTEDCGIVGIDIDHCLNDGKPNEVATDILSRLPPTYIEISPSGTGLHIFLRGKLPSGGNRNSKHGVEMYSSSRYFTMTGVLWKDCVDTIADDNGAIEWIHKTFITPLKRNNRTVFKSTTVVLTDDELLKLAYASKDGESFGKLYSGEWQGKYKSQSEADFALCCKLAFWSGRSEAQIDRLFRKSGLYRDKWDARHSADGTTYGEQTVKNACVNTTQVYTPTQHAKEPEIFEQYGCYYRRRGDKFYQITNFIVDPIEMITAEDEAQLTCDLVTDSGERFRQNLTASDMTTVQKFKGV
ncbi:MAG: DNA primase, partial [Clostridiaceae bacterium]|nr:DNA primase [Clostridiaceae bacterium]